LSELNSQETAGIPGITFPTSSVSDYPGKQRYLSETGGKWAVYKTTPGNGKWTDEIVALETEFIIQVDEDYTDLDLSRLLRDFMKSVSRISVRETWLIVDAQFPQSCRQTLQEFYHLCR
jgi:hypothetical protein